jgi:IstB-like ATP binding protein
MILRLCLNEMVLQSSKHELSLRQRQTDGPRGILVNRRAATNLVSEDGPIRPGHLRHDPPLHPAPRFADQADRSAPPGSGRSQRRSLMITANQPFGDWGKVFPDPAMTVTAIDRLVHHATIFEMNVESYRRRTAGARITKAERQSDDESA